MMLATFLTETAGGSSRFGSLVQRGLRILRHSLQGRAEQTKVPIGEPKFEVVSTRAVPTLRSSIKNVLGEAWKSQFVKNQTNTLVSRMKQRYEFRLMSGFLGWNRHFRGLAQTVARYGFVAVGVAGGSQWKNSTADDPVCKNIDHLIDQKEIYFGIEDNHWENFEYVSLLARARQAFSCDIQQMDIVSISSEESDIVILNEVEENEEVDSWDPDGSDPTIDDLLQKIGQLGSKQQADLFLILQECLTFENAELEQTLTPKKESKGDLKILRDDLNDALFIIELQNQQLWSFRETILRQNSILKFLQSHPMHHVCYEKLSADLEPDIGSDKDLENSDVSFEIISYEVDPSTIYTGFENRWKS